MLTEELKVQGRAKLHQLGVVNRGRTIKISKISVIYIGLGNSCMG